VPLSRPPREVKFVINGDPASKTFAEQGFVMDTGNGPRPFDPNRVDIFANLGATEEWTVTNTTGIIHPFHIHINPYQVTHINGQPHNALSYEDVTQVPANGSITFRTQFHDFPGTWVFHCHILGHEDGGMMAVIQVS
jgi:FtsP/CotA-like multicopper oxidase with cupredoxin domain